MECLSTGIRGFTTLHTDDVRKIPDRILNMMSNRMDADRMENDIYMFLDVGVLIGKKIGNDGILRRRIEQVCFFIRNEGKNTIYPVVLDGELITKELPKAVMEKFDRANIKPFEEGGSNEE